MTYTRDAVGRIAGITTQQTSGASVVSIAASASYEPFGPLSGFTFGNGLIASFTFDQDYQLTTIQAANGTATVQNLTNVYDPSGNITSITDHVTSSRSQSLTYDDLNRVATASGAYGAQSYSYDGVGNRLSRSANGLTDTYDYSSTSNRLNSVTSASGNVRSFTYAASGQVSQDLRDASDTYTFTVNANGRNAGASLNGATVGSYLYNAFGQRVQKVAGGITTQLVYDRFGHLLEEADASGTALRDYIWLDDLPVTMVDDTGSSPVIYYIHTDQLGTPKKMTDGSANIVWDNTSDPFGDAVATQGTGWGAANWGSFNWAVTMLSLSNLRFPGQYFDGETGLHQNWHRDYDPTVGRYVQSDLIGLMGGINTYAYVGGNPISLADPTGGNPALGAQLGAEGGFAIGGPPGAVVGALLGGMAGYVIADRLSDVMFNRPKNPPDMGPPGGWIQGPRRGRNTVPTAHRNLTSTNLTKATSRTTYMSGLKVCERSPEDLYPRGHRRRRVPVSEACNGSKKWSSWKAGCWVSRLMRRDVKWCCRSAIPTAKSSSWSCTVLRDCS
ncbi:MAG TPA: RHS repeat-associated core domain-containing protein [Trinickia sp.]